MKENVALQALLRFLTLALLGAQDDVSGKARDLVEKLQSERIEERDEAARTLKAMGKGALPELERAAKNSDPETAARARQLLQVVKLRDRLSADLLAALPGVEDRLASPHPRAWVEAFFEAERKVDRASDERLLKNRDLQALVAPALEAATVKEKEAMCKAAGARGMRSAIPHLMRLLDDADAGVRQQAVSTLSRELRGPYAPGAILKLLEDRHPWVRREVVEGLQWTAPYQRARVTSHLCQLLGDKDAEVAGMAAYVLGWLRAKDAIPPMIVLLKNPKAARSKVIWALGHLQEREAIPHLLPFLDHPELRSDAITALGKLESDEALQKLEEFLAGPDPPLRSHAALALGNHGGEKAVAVLARHLENRNADVRADVASALANAGARGSIPEIAQLLKDKSGDVRSAAAWALSDLGAHPAAREIAALFDDPDSSVRQAAVETVGNMGATGLGGEVARLLDDPDDRVREAALEALRDLRARDAAPRLLKLLKDQDPRVRWSACDALGDMRDASALSEMGALLEDPDRRVRASAVEALGSLGARDRAGAIRGFLNVRTSYLRAAACTALGVLGAEEAIPDLVASIEDDRWEVQERALEALG